MFRHVMPLSMGMYLAKMNGTPAPSVPASMRPYIKQMSCHKYLQSRRWLQRRCAVPSSQPVVVISTRPPDLPRGFSHWPMFSSYLTPQKFPSPFQPPTSLPELKVALTPPCARMGVPHSIPSLSPHF